ncbi:EF-hand domain-containing protein [Plasmodiophora brassicae]|uniref:Calmodulin n=1 Tax=Plasmodiophora brassicae TaxID=37360 RepID=A0A0G4IQS3_PLABS|nr:hypothetical protein PBRA_000887 [Plasmodiophora brassicae]SPQ97847.1 unnamed protein product [Plasmodiophora brassicae]
MDDKQAPLAISPEELEQLKQIFSLVDVDNGGSISQGELEKLLTTLGMRVTSDELDMMIREIDENSDGEIQFEEFVAVMSRKVNCQQKPDDVRRAFKVFQEGNEDGYVRVDTIEAALASYGNEVCTPEKAHQLVQRMREEADSRGLFNYNAFVKMVLED